MDRQQWTAYWAPQNQLTPKSVTAPGGFDLIISDNPVTVVPEPSTLTLLGFDLLGMGGYSYRKRRKTINS